MTDSVLGVPCPRHLYKYRCMDIRTLSALARNRLYLVDWKLLNDPFDCQTGAHFQEIIDHIVDNNIKSELKDLEMFRVCSLSSVKDDILMWGHYTDSHKGLCLEFNLEIDPRLKTLAWPIEYSDVYPDLLTPHPHLKSSQGHSLLKLFITKSTHWKYEGEWRLIGHVKKHDNSPAMDLPYKPEALTGIIFGMRMPDDQRQLVRKTMAQLPHIKYYEAVKDASEFKLNIVEENPSKEESISKHTQ